MSHLATVSWSGILLGGILGLVVGAAIGGKFVARRRAAPSVYDTLRRRLDEAPPIPPPHSEPTPPRPPRKPAAKKAPAKKAPTGGRGGRTT